MSRTIDRCGLRIGSLALLAWIAAGGVSSAASTPEQQCEAGQNALVGEVARCIGKAQQKFALDADGAALNAALTTCAGKFGGKWDGLVRKAAEKGADCPGTADREAVATYQRDCLTQLATALHGATLPMDATSCNDALETCRTNLQSCTSTHTLLPETGQTTDDGPSSDGVIRSGAPMSFTDNGDGTITDNVTGLMWEKKDDTSGLHGINALRAWSAGTGNQLDGDVATFLAQLNSGSGFAGHTDWRLPNIKELQSIVDYQTGRPATAFDSPTCDGCTDISLAGCSCAIPEYSGGYFFMPRYLSSTTNRTHDFSVWGIHPVYGNIALQGKWQPYVVRAVRGGL